MVLYLSNSQLDRAGSTMAYCNSLVLKHLSQRCQIQPASATRMRQAKNKKVVTIFDEALLLKRKTQEEIQFMLNYQMNE